MEKRAPDLRGQYCLPKHPVGVSKVAALVSRRHNASMEEITEIIDADRTMTQRLITMAYPRANARGDATIQTATSRLGLNRVIVLIVGDLLKQAITETFDTMMEMPLEMEDPTMIPLTENAQLTASVKFTGRATGQVTLAFSSHLALVIAAKLLGGDLEDPNAFELVNDAIGEVVNIVTGNLQSRLHDADLPSEVGLPEVTFKTSFPPPGIPGGVEEHYFYRHGAHNLGVHLSLAPF